jgi:hypothetical protein
LEIRKLTLEHIAWANAITAHSMVFYSPVWSSIYQKNQTALCYRALEAGEYFLRHQIESGMSFGIFDTNYQYRHPESAEAGGKLLWDASNADSTKEELLEQMDFPLVSVAMSYDGAKPLDMNKMMPFIDLHPLFGKLYHELEAADPRDPTTWSAQGPNEVLLRGGTSTRANYEGLGLMKTLAQWVMHEAARTGFRGIQIECLHGNVTKIWSNPPPPFKAELVSMLDLGTFEEVVDGQVIKPFAPSKQVCTKIYVTL